MTSNQPNGAASERIRPQRGSHPRTKELAGVVIVVAARNRRGAVLRCLESLRDSFEHRADVVFVGSACPDRSTEMVRDRFPFVRIVDCVESALHPARLDEAPPRFVLVMSPDVTLDRVAVRSLVRAAAGARSGSAVAPALVDPEGEVIDLPHETNSPVWIARRRDLEQGVPEAVHVRRDIVALVPRPDELVGRLEAALPGPR